MARLQARRYAALRGSPLEFTIPARLEAGGWAPIFGRSGPLTLEIGLGKDPHIIEKAAADPCGLFVGLEYSRKKLDKVIAKATRRGVQNLRVAQADAVRVLSSIFAPRSLCAVYVLFPDPWPKKRHRKKRLIQAPVAAQLASSLASGATLELRTDDADYLAQMLEVLEAEARFENICGPGRALWAPLDRERHIPTLFEEKFSIEGRPIHYLYYRRVAGAVPA